MVVVARFRSGDKGGGASGAVGKLTWAPDGQCLLVLVHKLEGWKEALPLFERVIVALALAMRTWLVRSDVTCVKKKKKLQEAHLRSSASGRKVL